MGVYMNLLPQYHRTASQFGIRSTAKVSPCTSIPLHIQPALRTSLHSQRGSWVSLRNKKITSIAQDKQADTEEERETKEANEAFNWTKAWYPVTTLEALDPSRPSPVMLLGKSFVLWRDGDGEWRCFEDACPHRLAPLSEGRIEESDGTLMCSYHGWRFDGDGECTRIPQSKTPEKCRHQRSQVQGFPVKVTRDMVWVWPDDSPDAFIEASVTEHNGKDVDEETEFKFAPMYMRDVYYPFDSGIENLIDLSHVPFAHHGIAGNRDTSGWNAGKWGDRSNPAQLRFLLETMSRGKKGEEIVREFELFYTAPGSINYLSSAKGFDGPTNNLILHVTPISSSRSRFFLQFVMKKAALPPMARLMAKILRPGWRGHLNTNAVLDSDMILLNRHARKMRAAEESQGTWNSEYYLPVSCDIPVSGFRSWLHGKVGGGGPKLPNGEPLLANKFEDESRETMLNRYHGHTKYCKSCSNALRWSRILKNVALGLCCGSVASCFMVARGLMKSSGGNVVVLLGAILGSLLCLFATKRLGDLESLFVHKGFEPWKM